MSAKVLIIEDDLNMLTLLRTLLRMEGYEVAAVEYDTDLDSLLSRIRFEMPQVVLMDVHLRQVSGIKLLEAIRQDESLNSTGILMSSGIDVREDCIENGADAFILKPFMPEELIQKIALVAAGRT